jgi:stage V sporulation protein K
LEISRRYAGETRVEEVKDYCDERLWVGKGAAEALDRLVGLDDVKEMIREIAAYSFVQRERVAHSLSAGNCTMHMIFAGNPGTGKTTVARIVGSILKEMNILTRGHLIEVERADLVGEFVGHTAQKTREQVKKALGGILFIDEAYTLAQGGHKDFGLESIATLVKAMEDHRENLVIVLAGYTENMSRFMRSNPGLASRFPVRIEFPDYECDELFAIAVQMYEAREYDLSSRARWCLKSVLSSSDPVVKNGNARFVRNLVEKSIRLQALRLFRSGEKPTVKELMAIEDVDIPRP